MTTITDVDQALEEAVNEAVECRLGDCTNIAAWVVSANTCDCRLRACTPCKGRIERTVKRTQALMPHLFLACPACEAEVPAPTFTYRFDPI